MNAKVIRFFPTHKEIEIKDYRIVRKQVAPLINEPISKSIKRKTLKAIKKF
jgi:hypothetical protein